MQRAVAQALGADVGAIDALELDLDPFVLEAPELDRRRRDEIGRRIQISNRKAEHPQHSGKARGDHTSPRLHHIPRGA